jgi:hypothetical protein
MTGSLQPMPDLTADQYDALRDDIADNGVHVTVIGGREPRVATNPRLTRD